MSNEKENYNCVGSIYCKGNYNSYGNFKCSGNSGCGGNLHSDGNIECQGNIGCNGNFYCDNNVSCDGNYFCNENHNCKGNYKCIGMINSKGQYKSMFCIDEKNKPKIFGIEVSEERADEINATYQRKCTGWNPVFTKAFELYEKHGNDWNKIPLDELQEYSNLSKSDYRKKAYKNMPQIAIDYIKSLPEYNKEVFTSITGIDVEKTDKGIWPK